MSDSLAYSLDFSSYRVAFSSLDMRISLVILDLVLFCLALRDLLFPEKNRKGVYLKKTVSVYVCVFLCVCRERVLGG